MRCVFTKENGEQCGSPSMRGAEYCYWHNPLTKEERREAASRGGSAIRVAMEDPMMEVDDLDDYVISSLQQMIATVKKLNQTAETARTMNSLISTLEKALERRESRIDEKTIVEVVYVNDWRPGGDKNGSPSISP